MGTDRAISYDESASLRHEEQKQDQDEAGENRQKPKDPAPT
jgi:hypothetical protein